MQLDGLVKRSEIPVKLCTVDGCDRPHKANGLCGLHYDRMRRTGSLEKTSNRKPKEKRYCSVEGCDRNHFAKNYCAMHYERVKRTGEVGPADKMKPEHGYGYTTDGYRVVKVNGKRILEHRAVMEQYLGRELLKEENVHHINGDRLDNRIENLELWSKRQPPGQRVSDKVNFAIEILKMYFPDCLKEDFVHEFD